MMKNPSHPGKIIAGNLEALEMSVSEGAKALGITRQQLHRIIACTSAVSPEMALRLEKGFGGSATFWLRMQASYYAAQIYAKAGTIHVTRLVGKAA